MKFATGAGILVLNAGSSSIKFALSKGDTLLHSGQIDGLGAEPRLTLRDIKAGNSVQRDLAADEASDHETALATILAHLGEATDQLQVTAVGHRVVHGGPDFADPIVITDDGLDALNLLSPLAPLHQPHNLDGIRAARSEFPQAVQIACFDTAFHRKHPWVNDTFALPVSYYDAGIRRYGFHGLSYEFICEHLKTAHPDAASGRLVVAHLGNGASMCAIRDGQSVGSTMGFSALDGLPMGTRCGQLDPGVLLYLMAERCMDANAICDLLYKQSGLKGLSGISHDMRELEASKDPRAENAIEYFVFRIRRELGAMAAVLGGLDTLVFTGGIGENAAAIRERICRDQDWLGLAIDHDANMAAEAVISTSRSTVKVLVVPTDEEGMIRRHVMRLISGNYSN